MPTPGRAWWHLILHTKGSWLHGDPRGFRSRDHRIHSNGDYKNLPPADEHLKLYLHQKSQLKTAVVIPANLYPIIGKALHAKCLKIQVPVLAISAGPTHGHLQIEYENNLDAITPLTSKLKQAASHAVRHELPGKIWARGGKPILIIDPAHQKRVFQYILKHTQDGDWVWSFRNEG